MAATKRNLTSVSISIQGKNMIGVGEEYLITSMKKEEIINKLTESVERLYNKYNERNRKDE